MLGSRSPNRLGVLVTVWTLALGLGGSGGLTPTAEAQATTGFRALSGPAAATFLIPADMRLVRRLALGAYGLTYER